MVPLVVVLSLVVLGAGVQSLDVHTEILDRLMALEEQNTAQEERLKRLEERKVKRSGRAHILRPMRIQVPVIKGKYRDISTALSTWGQIAFTAYLKSDLDHVAPMTPMVFDTVLHNDGGAYNNVTGVFTAPEQGVYFFTFFIANAAVLDYLNKQNRPYSVIDICNNLHKEFGKTAVQKACEGLAESGQIKEKIYGKQKVYVADQTQFPEVDDSEIKGMDKTITEKSEQLKVNLEEIKQLEAVLRNFNSCLSTEDAQTQLSEISRKCKQYKTKLQLLKEEGNVISPAEKEKVYSERKTFVQAWRKRKRLTNDILNAVLEGYPHPKKKLHEDIGIETDEEFGVKPPEV